jgi:CheY-like chemotaxis protein
MTARSAKPFVLIIDDDPLSAATLADVLFHAGHASDHARNGAEALDLLRNGATPRLILLDLSMPVMDGWTFREQQMQDPNLSTIPVIVITGAIDTVGQALALDVDDYFTKPYNPFRLVEMVERHCGTR